MKKGVQILVYSFLLLAFSFSVKAQSNNPDIALTAKTDSLKKDIRDSLLIEELKQQIQELKMNEILAHNESKNVRLSQEQDSINRATQRLQIDSLRNHTDGIPLVIEGDTILELYTKRGGVMPQERIRRAEQIIMAEGKSLAVQLDSVYVFNSEHAADIMIGDKVIITFTDLDGLWQNSTKEELANKYCPIISEKLDDLHAQYGLTMKIKNVLYTIIVIAIQAFLIYLTNRLFKRSRRWVFRLMRHKLHPISIKNYELFNEKKQAYLLLFSVAVIRVLVIFFQLIISIPIIFSIFPETKDLAYTLFSYIWAPLKDIFASIGGFIPDLIQIIVILFIFRYVNKGLKYITNEIATDKLQINGFYSDWAYPTYYILRFLLYSFMFIMIWPLLPNSQSDIFKGVSVFVGLVISLGSTTVIGNLMAGMVLTYMRSFRVGDQVKLKDIMGVVVEKTPFVTRIRTRQNEIISLPNATVMSSETVNYSMSIEHRHSVIVTADVVVGYEVDKKFVQELLVEAALNAKGILAHPKPVVFIPKLDDFYCCYQVNAHTREVKTLARITSELNEQIINKMHEAGIELLSPHYYAQRDGSESALPPKK